MTASVTYSAKNELRPFIPLLIGRGKLARHLAYYLTQHPIPFESWPDARKLDDPNFAKLLARVNCVWILVSDKAIREVSMKIRDLAPELTQLHSSATTEVPGTLTLHPLQTFGPDLYSREVYHSVPFMMVTEEWAREAALKRTFESLFPNPTFEISNSERALYHAYCVMMANFPQLLWGKVQAEADLLKIKSADLFKPMLKQTLENFLKLGTSAVTGPLMRGDLATITAHKKALRDSPLLPLYLNFVSVFSKFEFSKTDSLKESL